MSILLRSLLTLLLAAPLAAAEPFTIDAVHSEVAFRIRHLVSRTPGRFVRFQGTLQLDAADLSRSSVEATIDAASISTDNESRDKHLRSADFFDVAKYPTLTFRSVSVKVTGRDQLEVSGDLTMKGITRRIVLPVTFLGTLPSPMDQIPRAGFEATLKLKRADFGMSGYPGVLGDEVEISLNIEAMKVMGRKP